MQQKIQLYPYTAIVSVFSALDVRRQKEEEEISTNTATAGCYRLMSAIVVEVTAGWVGLC
jgi:hypothetical protein